MLNQIHSDPRWYVINTHSRQEERADSNFKAWRIETFAPKLKKRVRNMFGQRPGYKIVPMFPGYIFARFDAGKLLHKIRFTRGVCSVVSFGGQPTPVDDYIIRTLKERANEEGLVNLYDDIEPGSKVTIVAGPFKDFTGVFERHLNDAQRVMILMQTVNYQTHVVLERELVQRV